MAHYARILRYCSDRCQWRTQCRSFGQFSQRIGTVSDAKLRLPSNAAFRHISSLSGPSKKPSMVLFDSLSESYKEVPLYTDPDSASGKALAWYTCGPTVYGPAHAGHARTYVCLDIIRRVLEHVSSIPPLFVMNITDVDDKILAAARESNNEPTELARRFETDFWNDWDRLGCLRPHVVTRVTEHVESAIVPYIERIYSQGMAYTIDNDGVYFDVRAYEGKLGTRTKYGKLAPPSAATDFFSRQPENGGDNKDVIRKRDPRDFVLWKLRKPDETLCWCSPWGEGRPGWHIECSAMIEAVQKQFQDTHHFMVHAGGVDLKFPHHTNEIAQAEAYYADAVSEWIPHWVHTGHLHIHGMKMSKSLKNFITVKEMLEEGDTGSSLSSPADDFRLWCLGLSGSYRGPATYSTERIEEARVIREQLVQFMMDGSEWIRKSGDASNKTWGDNEHTLFGAVVAAQTSCRNALLGDTVGFDMNGTAFVRGLVQIAETGSAFCRNSSPGSAPTEPLQMAIQTLRELLALVGFSDATVRAGMIGIDEHSAQGEQSRIVGGEARLAEEFVHFREEVRKIALASVKQDPMAASKMKDILALCDNVRERVLPSIGLELNDGKGFDSDNQEEKASASTWRFCVPREGTLPSTSNTEQPHHQVTLNDIAVEDLFRIGQYKGMFSEFDETGFPLRNADGSDLSNRLQTKLLKKRDKHIKRLEDTTTGS